MQFDTTIHLSDLVMVAGGVVVLWRVGMTQRDFNRQVTRLLMGDAQEGQPGIIRDVGTLKEDVSALKAASRIFFGHNHKGNGV